MNTVRDDPVNVMSSLTLMRSRTKISPFRFILTSSPVRSHLVGRRLFLTPQDMIPLPVHKGLLRTARRSIRFVTHGRGPSTYASGFPAYPNASDGVRTTSSPGSSNSASVPSGFSTLAAIPGISCPALPLRSHLFSRDQVVMAVQDSVVPGV
jgi:hypothetical protein